MRTIPHTSLQHYITGMAALNVPNPDGSFADWHFDEVFLSGRGKIRIAGKDTETTYPILGNYGIRECSDTLRQFGVNLSATEKVYSANHIRAILDLIILSLNKNKIPHHIEPDEYIDSENERLELKSKISELKLKIPAPDMRFLLSQWEQIHF